MFKPNKRKAIVLVTFNQLRGGQGSRAKNITRRFASISGARYSYKKASLVNVDEREGSSCRTD